MADAFEFESAQLVREECPDDWRKWPQKNQDLSQTAIDRLLKQNPGAKIINETSMLIRPGHPRYPDHDETRPWNNGAFYLLRTIKLDRPAQNG